VADLELLTFNLEIMNVKSTENQETTNQPLLIASVGSSVSFAEWKRAMRKEQLYYPALKFQKIREDYLEHYWREGYTPTDACNDILTA
jgi:hypothetical protein